MAILSYTDTETGELVEIDVTGWQFVIDTEAGEVMRVDWPSLALLVQMQSALQGAAPWKVSLLRPPGMPVLYEPPEWWLDILVERR